MANLVFLDLGYNSIGTTGALALARSTTLAALTELNLRGNRIGPKGIAALRQRFGEGLLL
jgi:Leucine Rich repeat